MGKEYKLNNKTGKYRNPKKTLLIIGSVFLILIVIFSVFFGLSFCPVNNFNQELANKGFLQCSGTKIVDNKNQNIQLRGFNLGNWLVPEGWLSFFEIDGQDNETNGKKLTYLKMIDALQKNPNNFSQLEIDELLTTYYEHYICEEDIKWISQNGFNLVRLPFAYFNIMDEEYNIKEDGFKYLDRCLDWCKKYKIYCILDCHGAVGSQNKEHHSGDDTRADLYSNNEYREITKQMWATIADRYKDNIWVAGYDLLNEPTNGKTFTFFKQWNFYDELYHTIRQIDNNHIIILESCWGYLNMPNPLFYGWKNVVYSYHFYNPKPAVVSNNTLINYKKFTSFFGNHNTPVFIGEFAMGDSKENLQKTINYFNSWNYSFAMWTYKSNDSWNWSMFQMWKDKINLSSASYEEIRSAFADCKTNYNNKSDACKLFLEIVK